MMDVLQQAVRTQNVCVPTLQILMTEVNDQHKEVIEGVKYIHRKQGCLITSMG